MKIRVIYPSNFKVDVKIPLKQGESKVYDKEPEWVRDESGSVRVGLVVEKVVEKSSPVIKTEKGKKAGWRVIYPSNFAVLPKGETLPIKQGESRVYEVYPAWVDLEKYANVRHLLVIEKIEVKGEEGEAKPPKKK